MCVNIRVCVYLIFIILSVLLVAVKPVGSQHRQTLKSSVDSCKIKVSLCVNYCLYLQITL